MAVGLLSWVGVGTCWNSMGLPGICYHHQNTISLNYHSLHWGPSMGPTVKENGEMSVNRKACVDDAKEDW